MRRKSVSNRIAVALLLIGAGAAAHADEGPDAFGRACAALEKVDFSQVLDAPTRITKASMLSATSRVPAHCQVLGQVLPHVGIELRLPASGWNGKFLHVGCGGWCGLLPSDAANSSWWPARASACDVGLRKGYACIANDSGHKDMPADAQSAAGLMPSTLQWAHHNVEAEIDYAYRATHVATLAGKAIVERFYAKVPTRTYLLGCSGGGREGMLSAQRFPWDFDGIVSLAPAISVTGGVMRLLWNDLSATAKDGRPLFTPADLRLINKAAIARCDLDDGVADGVISHPPSCGFDPQQLLCRAGKEADCLSEPQVAAAKKIYAGPMNSRGQKLYTSGVMPGTELGWNSSQPSDQLWESELFRYMGFVPDPGQNWNARDFDFDRDYRRLGMMESLLGATNPDLRRFKAAGGKLIAATGWADALQDGTNLIDYYETAQRTMGGRAATEEFFRLFMLPGVDHCSGGPGADTVDYLAYLEAWVEKGIAPDVLLAARMKPDSKVFFPDLPPLPLDPAKVELTRPLYPYPVRARYKGTGNPNDAASFEPF
jgi:feruloyl esterase